MNCYTILIADDDAGYVKVLKKAFIEKDFQVYTADNGMDALKQYHACMPKIILMDIDMPEKNGWEVLAQIRKENRFVPVIIMTNKKIGGEDAIKSYNDGASFFIRKPDSYRELIVTVGSMLKNTYFPEDIFTFGKFRLNMSSQFLLANDEEYPFTGRETQLLCLLIKNINKAVETKSILNFVWGDDNRSNNQMLRNSIAKLNKLLEKNGGIRIKSIYGKGYALLCE